MTEHDVLDRLDQQLDEQTAAYFEFLESEFPGWEFELEATETWSGDAKPLWIATQEGHHPQAALTAGKLHRRLEDYEARNSARFASRN